MSGIPDDDPDRVYRELPPGLIDLPTASKKYCVKPGTLWFWVRKGNLGSKGRLKGPATGGGYLVICEEELVAYIEAPRNKGGRPPRKSRKNAETQQAGPVPGLSISWQGIEEGNLEDKVLGNQFGIGTLFLVTVG